ncbi:MAG: hypothetical protein DWH91_02385 [Planctomycetota bacterium]|nr:MAG: hypothetical protein DWH91_02385 [Planctomycetota bacterium]
MATAATEITSPYDGQEYTYTAPVTVPIDSPFGSTTESDGQFLVVVRYYNFNGYEEREFVATVMSGSWWLEPESPQPEAFGLDDVSWEVKVYAYVNETKGALKASAAGEIIPGA